MVENLGKKLYRQADFTGDLKPIAHWCPGCNSTHAIAVDEPFRNGHRWSFDGNIEKPTFNPSVNIRIGPFRDGKMRVCHYFLHAGRIQYLGDCTHELAGQTIDLPDLPDRYLVQFL